MRLLIFNNVLWTLRSIFSKKKPSIFNIQYYHFTRKQQSSSFHIWNASLWDLGDPVPHHLKEYDQVLGPASKFFPVFVMSQLECRGETKVEGAALWGQTGQLVVVARSRILEPYPGSARSCGVMKWRYPSLANERSGCGNSEFRN